MCDTVFNFCVKTVSGLLICLFYHNNSYPMSKGNNVRGCQASLKVGMTFGNQEMIFDLWLTVIYGLFLISLKILIIFIIVLRFGGRGIKAGKLVRRPEE